MTNSFQQEILKCLVRTEFYKKKRNKQILKSNYLYYHQLNLE